MFFHSPVTSTQTLVFSSSLISFIVFRNQLSLSPSSSSQLVPFHVPCPTPTQTHYPPMDATQADNSSSDNRRMSCPVLDFDSDICFDTDFPLIDRISGQPAAYVLMKHINRLAADQKLTTDENNNESDSTDRKRHPFGHRSLGYHFRSNSVDLACDCVSEPDLTNLADVGALSKSVQTLSLTGRERSSSVADLTIELGDFSSFETSSIVNKSDSSDAIESDDKIDGSDLDRLPVFAQGPLDRCSCIICLDERTLHRRLCCDFAACDSCLAAYYEHKLQLGQFSMECINSACRTPAGRDEIRALLCPKSRDIYRSLLLANNDLGKLTRTCPQCNHLMRLRDSAQLKLMRSQRKKDQTASRVTCDQCGHLWCFLCHAPWHQQITCKQFQEGDRLLRNWAKQINQGQVNAQKCPTCKTFIQRSSGCDHMHCRNCQTDFCYQCGEKLRHLKFFGNHYSKLSVFGCKYRYRAEQPVLRRTVRVSVFCAKLAAAPALCSAAVAAVGVAVAVGVVILPLYGLVRLGRWTMDKQQRKDVRAFAFHSSDSSQPKANDFIHPPNRFGLVCSGGNSNNGSARLLASARQLQRLTGNKTPAYPRLNRFVTLNSSGVSASGDSSESDARTGPNGLSSVYDIFSHKKESVEQVRTDSSAKQVDSSAFYSYIDLSDRPAIESRSTSTVDKSGTTGVFTMDYDSLDRIEQWSLNRTVFGMGQPSNLTRGEESLSTDQSIGSHSVGRQSKSRSGQSIKKNFILTSLF